MRQPLLLRSAVVALLSCAGAGAGAGAAAAMSTSAAARAPRVALVTGATDGIGRLTARLLAADGFTVLLHGRSQTRLAETRDEIERAVPGAQLETFCSDLQLTTGANALADSVLGKHASLSVVVQNAGVFMDKFALTEGEGIESTFAVNVVAPFILARRLLPALQQCPDARMLMVSSISQSDGGRLDLTTLPRGGGGGGGGAGRGFDKYAAYGLSKRCMAMLAHELALRCGASSPSPSPVVLSCDPGTVNTKMLLAGWGRCGIDVEAATDEFNLVRVYDPARHGKYYVGCRETKAAPEVYDAARRAELWALLETLAARSSLT